MKKIAILIFVISLMMLSSENLYSQTNKENKNKSEIKTKKSPGEPVSGAEVFEEQENTNKSNTSGGKTESNKKRKKKEKKQQNEKGKKD